MEPKVDSSGLKERDIVDVTPPEAVVKSDSDLGSDFAAAATQDGFKSPSKELLATKENVVGVMKSAETIPAAPMDISEGAIAEPTDLTAAKVIDAAPSAAVSEECKKADAEVVKASESKEPADQLFHYRRALRLCPGKAEYHLGLGRVYQSLKRSSDAEFEFREALRLDPSLSAAKESLEKVRF
jgi:tetratricopeptide (TPR) repeat protein